MQHHSSTLSNGLTLIQTPMAAVHSVSIAIFVGLGSRYETAGTAGVSHMLEHMMFKGTKRRPRAADISDALDSVGGVLNASTDKEVTVYWAKVAAEHLPLAIDLLSDMLLHSRVSPSDLAREKGVVLEELGMLADDPQDWVHVLADEVLWPHQPLGWEVAGTRDSVAGLRTRELRAYLDTYYGVGNVVISVAGGIELDETAARFEEYFGGWRSATAPSPPPAWVPDAGPRSRIEYKPTEQVNLCLVYPSVARDHPDRWPLEVLGIILGGGTSSRLFLQLREKQALAYDIHAYTTHFSDTGAMIVYAGTEGGKAPRVLEGVFREIDRFQRRRVPAAELRKAQQYFRGRLWLGLEDTQSVASWFGGQEMLQRDVMGPEGAARAVDSVTPDDLLRVARTYLTPEQARLAAVGPVLDLNLETRLAGA